MGHRPLDVLSPGLGYGTPVRPVGVFEEAALNAVRAWRYKPMVIRGEVQRAENVRSTLRFEIGEPERYEDL